MYSIFHVEILCLYFNVSGYLFLVKVKYFWELHIFIILCGSKYLNVLALPLADEVVCVRRKRYGCLPDFTMEVIIVRQGQALKSKKTRYL